MSYPGAPRRREGHIRARPLALHGLGGPTRAALTVLFAAALAGLLQVPAGAQEIPTPTPPPTAEPSPSPSAAPAESAPVQQEKQLERVRPRKGDRQQSRRPKKHRRAFRQERRKNHLRATCAPFTFNQTYSAWGPALTYGRTVTVTYEASRCSKPNGSALDLSVDGTATVYDGTAAEGIPLDVRGFTVSGTWDRPSNSIGWPPNWWECGVTSARYNWQIPGVYSFNVSARWGVWTLSVETQGAVPTSIHWSYNGCG